MIRKLRWRFIRIVMEAFLAVMLALLLAVNLVNRYNVYQGIDARLSYLSESSLGPPSGMLAIMPQEIRGWVDQNNAGIMSEASYFIFSGYMAPHVLAEATEHLTLAAGQDGESLIAEILAGSEDFGNAGSYRYYAASRDVPYKIVFLRCENEFASMRSLLKTSVAAGLVCFLLVLSLVTLLSEKAIEPFAQNVENQKRFISNASHELKTPLGVIMSDIDLQIMETGRTEWLSNAQMQADHLALLIDQLTTYSLLDEKKQDAASVPVDLSALGEAILSDFRPLALSRDLTLSADIAPEVSVSGNEDAFRTLLSVLMDNAVKYTPEGGSVRLSIRRDKKALIRLENTCEAIEDIALDQLFERFYRMPEHRASQDGHGLGLSIAHEIAALYGGSIRAECPDGHSVAFTVTL